MAESSLVTKANIQSIYCANWLHTTLWAYVSAQKRAGKQVTDAIDDFMDFFGLEDMERGTLNKIYMRKNQEYRESAGIVENDMRAQIVKEEDQLRKQTEEKVNHLKLTIIRTIDEYKM